MELKYPSARTRHGYTPGSDAVNDAEYTPSATRFRVRFMVLRSGAVISAQTAAAPVKGMSYCLSDARSVTVAPGARESCRRLASNCRLE